MHAQSTAVLRFVFVSLVDVNPSRAKHDLVMRTVDNFPDTKFTDDRHILGSCLLDKGVVGQLATRVIAFILRKGGLGLFAHWLVSAQSRARLQRSDHGAEG